MSTASYQIGILGAYESYADDIVEIVRRNFIALDYNESDFAVLVGDVEVMKRDRMRPFAALYFGSDSPQESATLTNVVKDSVVVIPLIPDIGRFRAFVPETLRGLNGLQIDRAEFDRVVGVLLENFRLLRRERRLFISYRRTDSSGIAAQLYEALDARQFDVFLDTRGVPPGKDFQSVLWHRLADSDVVVVLGSPNFTSSRWTMAELSRAYTTNLQMLHLTWPGESIDEAKALAVPFQLDPGMFKASQLGDDARLDEGVIAEIVRRVESLRAQAMALRSFTLVDAFCDEARRLGFETNVQASRHVTLDGRAGRVVAVPMVGVPSALRLHDVHRELSDAKDGEVWALFDDTGLLQETIDHLNWLNLSLPVQSVRLLEVAARLSEQAADG